MTLTRRSQWIAILGHTINQLITPSTTSNCTHQLDMWKKVLVQAALLHNELPVIDYSVK